MSAAGPLVQTSRCMSLVTPEGRAAMAVTVAAPTRNREEPRSIPALQSSWLAPARYGAAAVVAAVRRSIRSLAAAALELSPAPAASASVLPVDRHLPAPKQRAALASPMRAAAVDRAWRGLPQRHHRPTGPEGRRDTPSTALAM